MKKYTLISFLLSLSISIFAQEGNIPLPKIAQQYSVSYKQLKQYEGLYAYVNNTTLKIAASPKDTVLYAIINESKYKLSAVEKDLFLDMTKNKVHFFRNKKNEIAGYYAGKDTFQLLDKKIKHPKEMWYARHSSSKNEKYVYKQPKNINDGLTTGHLDKSGLDKTLLNEMMQKIIDGTYPNVHSILIIKDGKLVFEEYFYEHNKTKLHEMRSATKSVVSALTGIAIDNGFIKSKDEKVLPFFPEYTIENNSEAKKKITIEHLLTNQSGLDCDVSNPNSIGNETTMNNAADWVKYTLDLPMTDSAGGKGMYCSGNPITLGKIIEKTTKQNLSDYAKNNLFAPLGIKDYVWNFKPDQSSVETFCQVYLTSRAMAKFGLLYLNQGNWNGKQIISKDWVAQSFQKHSIVQGVNYGYLWWNKYLEADGTKYYSFAAQGNGGQKIYVFQEQNLVVVTTAGHYNTQSPINEIVGKYILPTFNKKNIDLDTFRWFDKVRQREIPVAIFQPKTEKKLKNQKIVIFSHGYGQNKGGDYLAYSYLTEKLADEGYFVVSIQHELSTDSLLPLTGIPQKVRRPFWERGADNILFVIDELKKINPDLDFKHITLIGHSNGGDMTALFPQKYPNIVDKIITLDNRRMALPKSESVKVYSLRSSDQLADEGVLPTEEEQNKFGIKIVKLPNTTHNEMDDNANPEQRKEITSYILRFLNE